MGDSRLPWLRIPAPAPCRRTAIFLLATAWTMAGLSLWAVMGARTYLIGLRPTVILDAFLGEGVSAPQIEALSQAIQSRPFCCDLKFVSAEEARAEAGEDEQVKPILEAFGGNPFLRFFRATLCPTEMDGYRKSAEWLRSQPGIVSIRIPTQMLEGALESERRVQAAIGTAVILTAIFGLLVAFAAMRLLIVDAWSMLNSWEALGASGWQTGLATLWTLNAPSLLVAVLVSVALKLAGVLTAVCGGWLHWQELKVPEFPYMAAAWLALGALVVGLTAAIMSCLARRFSRAR
jgi:cell division protein FtsX